MFGFVKVNLRELSACRYESKSLASRCGEAGTGRTRHASSFFSFAKHPSASLASDYLKTGVKDTAGAWRDPARSRSV